MARSWELTEDQKKEIQEQQREIGAQYDPETGRKKVRPKTQVITKMSKAWKVWKAVITARTKMTKTFANTAN